MSFFVNSSYDTGIITSEFLYNLPYASVNFLKRYLRKWNIEILFFIVCIREPISRIVSSYQQTIIKGNDITLIDHINKKIEKESKIIDLLKSNFKNQNLKIFTYNKNSLVNDFFSLIDEKPYEIPYKNSSNVSFEYLYYLRKYNNRKFQSLIIHKTLLRIIFLFLCIYYFKIGFWKQKVNLNLIFIEIFNRLFLLHLPKKNKKYKAQTIILDYSNNKIIYDANKKYNQFIIKNGLSDDIVSNHSKIEIPKESIYLDQSDIKNLMRLKLLLNFQLYFQSIFKTIKKLIKIINYENN